MSPPVLRKPIALGRTAEIYAWEEGQVLKLFHDWVPEASARYEAEIARRVGAAGVRIPQVGELVEVEGRLGLVYERVDGNTLLQVMLAQPRRMNWAARLLAQLQAEIHACSGEGLPSQKERLRRKIERAEGLENPLKQQLLAALDRLPDGQALCHGDFHPDNIQMTARGPVVIDWNDATCGHPLADVARTLLLIDVGSPPAGPLKLEVDALRGRLRRVYLQRYWQLSGFTEAQMGDWLPVVAAARLQENIPGEEERLLRLAAGR
jgi:uncharacterized protein (TIGR02172 family)